MKNIKKFRSVGEYNDYVDSNIIGTKNDYIAKGLEGNIYITRTGEILKDIRSNGRKLTSDIIMSSDLELNSFIFPDELYVINDLIMGYKTRLFKGDIFMNNRINSYKKREIDIDALINARKKIIEDIKVLTRKGYNLLELRTNILFNNKELCAIDTLDYEKDRVKKKKNIEYLDYGLIDKLYEFGLCNGYENNFENVITKIKRK